MTRPCSLLAFVLLVGCHEDPDVLDDAGQEDPDQPPVEGLCDLEGDGADDPFADCVEDFDPAGGVSFGHDAMPEIVLGPPLGAGLEMGSEDVASLGCGGSITLAFAGPGVEDGPGPDLLVFENAFVSGAITFVEPAEVLVSDDGVRWRRFPCEPDGSDEPPDGCAGLRPVLADDEAGALDPMTAGGDPFDLADVGLDRARYVRIVDRTREHYGSETWCAGATGGFDLDAVVAIGGPP